MDESLSPPPHSPKPDAGVNAIAHGQPIRGDATRAGALQLAISGVRLVIMLASAMLLARLLTPADFGVYAMVATLTALVENLRGFGLGQALVHESEWNEQRAARVWRGLLLACAGASAVAMVAAYPLAAIYDEPALVSVTLVMSIGVFFVSLPAVWEARLVRQLRFAPIARADVGALVLSVIGAIVLAMQGAGYWALVAQYVLFFAGRAALLRLGSGPLQRVARVHGNEHLSSDTSVRTIFSYGRHVTLAQFVVFAGRTADRVVVGIFAGPVVLGLYANSYKWSMFAFEQIFGPLHNVILSTLNRARRSGDSLGNAVVRVLSPPMSVVLPLLMFLAIETEVVVRVLLGPQWDAAVPILRVLCGAAAANSVIRLSRILHLVTGSTARQLRFAIAQSIVLVTAVIAGVQKGGTQGVAWAVVIATCVLAPAAVWYSTYESAVRALDVWRAVARAAFAAAAAGAVMFTISPPLAPDAGPLAMLIRAATYGLAYCVLWVLIPGGKSAVKQLVVMLGDLRGSSNRG